MAIREIVKKGDELLYKICKDVVVFDEKLHILLEDMKETMFDANGVGLAGPQVGMLRRVAVVLNVDTDEVFEIINPEIIEKSGDEAGIEGCLSVPEVFGIVHRPTYVKVKFQDRFGNLKMIEAEDFFARVFCHEIDHLYGNLFDDKVVEFIDPSEMEME